MNWKIKIFSYLTTDFLLELFSRDKVYFQKIADQIFKEYYLTLNRQIEYDNVILQYINIYPQIKFLETNHILEHHEIIKIISNDTTQPINRYILNGNPNKDLIYSNYVLPHPSNSCIPFSIGISKNDKFKIITSNIFYFEVYLDTYNFRKPFVNESLIVGFSKAESEPYNTRIGANGCFGFNILESKLDTEDEENYLPELIGKGDTVGIGLEYVDKYEYKLFITVNGKMLNFTKEIKTTAILRVVANISMSTGIDINFGNKEFVFDLEKINTSNKIIHSTKNNFINRGFNLEKLESDYFINNKPLTKEYIYNLIPNQ